MNEMNSQEEQALAAQLKEARGRLQGLTADLRAVDEKVESLAPQRTHHELLDQACGSLEKLGEMGAGSLFWGDGVESTRVAEQLRGARSRVSAFQARLGELDGQRQSILAKIGREEQNLEILGDDLYYVREEEARRKLEWVVERDGGSAAPHVRMMAWARGGEEDRRFHKALGASLLGSLLLGVVLPMIDLPLPRRFQPDEMPERLAQLVRQEQARLLPPPPVAPKAPPEQKPPEQPKPKPDKEPKPSQTPPETPAQAEAKPQPPKGDPGPSGMQEHPPGEPPAYAGGGPQKKPGKPGILAFRDKFASLAQDKVPVRLGASARFTDADDAPRPSSRSMLTTNAPGSSGGINLASLSHSLGGGGGGAGAVGGNGGGGGGGGGIPGVPVGHATSPIASIGGGDRPLARGGLGPSRTDEEIQIVFDRYKASFYRLYNRELRNDPTLQGQMVLRLTIEPDGSVSMCVLQSTDMNAPDLAAQVVNRVKTINFGAKEGVKALTIVYPIDFLPAA